MMTENQDHSQLLYVLVGGGISIVTAIIAIWGQVFVDWRRSKRDDKKVREAILSEIKANVEYGMRTDPFWMDNIYKNHLDKIYGFEIKRFQKITRFYALIDKYREREAQYSADLQHEKKTELSRDRQQVLADMEKKIHDLGNEILGM